MVFAQEMAVRMRGTISASTSRVARPAIFLVAARYSPLSVFTRASWSGSRPVRLAKPSRAGVAGPSARKAARTGGPITCSSRSGSRSGKPERISTSRRGVKPVSTSRGPRPRAISSSNTRVASSRTPGSSMRAGISSLLTSKRYSPRGIGHLRHHRLARLALEQWETQLLAALHVGLGAADREVAHPLHQAHPLGDRDGAAGVQHVERMRALEGAFVGREHQPGLQAAARLALVAVKLAGQESDVGQLEVVAGELVLLLLAHLAVFEPLDPVDLVDALREGEEHGEPLETIGDLGADRLQLQPARLLEVGELGDLHAVEHHLPADPPGAERGGLPVVLLEAEVVLGEVEPDRLQAADVEPLHVERRGLEDHLELVVLAEPERVVAIAAVGRPARRLHVGDAPRLGPPDAQEGVGMHGAGPPREAERVLQHAPLAGPEFRKLEDQLLKGLHGWRILSCPGRLVAPASVGLRRGPEGELGGKRQ